MTDGEYVFWQTSAERKRNGIGGYHKKRGGGRYVRLPSDNLTAKERKALNSDVTKYNLAKPVGWAEFKRWPSDLARQYILRLEDTYNARSEDIAKMLGIGHASVLKYRKALGCPSHPGGTRAPLDRAGWDAFLRAPVESSSVDTKSVELLEKIDGPSEAPAKVAVNYDSVESIAALLRALKGTGARLTIEVVL